MNNTYSVLKVTTIYVAVVLFHIADPAFAQWEQPAVNKISTIIENVRYFAIIILSLVIIGFLFVSWFTSNINWKAVAVIVGAGILIFTAADIAKLFS